MDTAIHHKLKSQLLDIMSDIKSHMTSRFAVALPYDEMQDLLINDDATANLMRSAGALMIKQYTSYDYKLGEKVTITLNCRGGTKMPTILFPSSEFTNFSEDFLDLIRPLYLVTKSWMDVTLAFEGVTRVIEDTRELNFFVPWLRTIIPEREFTSEFSGKFHATRWLNLERERHSTIELIRRQIEYLLKNETTSKRTWMPGGLVQMARQGGELIAQYNMVKTAPMPANRFAEDMVSVEIHIDAKEHPTIKWASEASLHAANIQVDRLKKQEVKRAGKVTKGDQW